MERMNDTEIGKALKELHGWSHKDGMITKSFKFKNFKETFSVMTRIAFECEAQNHHPNWENVYNTLNISLNTHDVGGVTQKDIALAKSIENIIG